MAHELLRACMEKGFLLDREMLSLFSHLTPEQAQLVIMVISRLGVRERVITQKVFAAHRDTIHTLITSLAPQKMDVSFLSMLFGSTPVTPQDNESRSSETLKAAHIKLLSAPAFPQRKIVVADFVKHFQSRYEQIRTILEARDLENLTTIRKLSHSTGNYTLIGAVLNKRITKNRNILFTVEDLTGTVSVLVNQQNKELFAQASRVLLDDVLAFQVTGNSERLFCNALIFPDAGLSEKRHSTEDVWVAFTSDYHCGSKQFLETETLRFITWLNGESSDPTYRDIAKKVKYLFVVGDLVDGVNHYPGQEKDLAILSCRGQYKKFEELMSLVRSDIDIIISPGNHDAVWVGEPQPIIGEKWASGLYAMPNVHLVPNPALVELCDDFTILLYHGAGMHAFVEEIPEIRTKYGRQSPTIMTKEMLLRRHLAPIHGLVDYIPCERDPMVINTVPDVVVTGDLHTLDISMYNNILLIASSCWQSQTDFMEKVGVKPDPCKVPLLNLRTRELKILDFSSTPHEIKWNEEDDLFCALPEATIAQSS